MNTSPASCHNCGGQPTINAHIVPRGFARDAKGDGVHLIGVTEQGEHINQSGFIDQKILCATCDGRLGNDDKFAVEFCRQHRAFNPEATVGRVKFPGDPIRLARFANAVVYRASLSKLPSFNSFNIGAGLEQTLRRGLFEQNSLLCEAVIFRYRVNGEIDPFDVFTYPYVHGDKSGVQFANFSLGRFRFSVRVAGSEIKTPLREAVLNTSNVICSYCVDFERTTEYARMAELSKMHPKQDTQ